MLVKVMNRTDFRDSIQYKKNKSNTNDAENNANWNIGFENSLPVLFKLANVVTDKTVDPVLQILGHPP
jgi:hypothetical protein